MVPGAVIAWALWLAAVWGYTVYLRSVPSYSVTYGSLGGIVVTLFFFYISALLFIFGAEVNSVLRRRNEAPPARAYGGRAPFGAQPPRLGCAASRPAGAPR